MSRENVEIVRAQYAAFGRLAGRDEVRAHVLGYYDPECEYRPVEELDAIRGHEAMIDWVQRWLEAWSSFSVVVEEAVDGGETVIATISTGGRGRTSGVEIRQRFFHVVELRDGRILREREYLDRGSALAAAGLPQ